MPDASLSLTKRVPFGFRLSFLQDRRRMRVHTCMLYTVRPMFRADEADVLGRCRAWLVIRTGIGEAKKARHEPLSQGRLRRSIPGRQAGLIMQSVIPEYVERARSVVSTFSFRSGQAIKQ